MRRTAWDCIWVDLDLVALEQEAAAIDVELNNKGKQVGQFGHDWNGPSEMKIGEISTNGGIDETSHWGVEGVGVKVWVRRTIIYQLINLMERIVY
jgi:hypothetical protein